MAGHPLQGGVGDEDVEGLAQRAGSQLAQVGQHPLDPPVAVERPGRLEHLSDGVDADDAGVRPALGEGQRGRPVPAAQVDDGCGVVGAHLRDSSTNGRPRSPAYRP